MYEMLRGNLMAGLMYRVLDNEDDEQCNTFRAIRWATSAGDEYFETAFVGGSSFPCKRTAK